MERYEADIALVLFSFTTILIWLGVSCGPRRAACMDHMIHLKMPSVTWCWLHVQAC